MRKSSRGWWERQSQLRATARRLNTEFSIDGPVRYYVKAHGGRSLELLVSPESGLDNFVERVHSQGDVERVESEFRRLAGLYAEGRRPPFGE
jgi:hypothetical protein